MGTTMAASSEFSVFLCKISSFYWNILVVIDQHQYISSYSKNNCIISYRIVISLSVMQYVSSAQIYRCTWTTTNHFTPIYNICIGIEETILGQWYIDDLVQNCCNSSALAIELLQFCTKPSICFTIEENLVWPQLGHSLIFITITVQWYM